MPSSFTGSSRPTAIASSADLRSDHAIGSTVKWRFSQAPSITAAGSALPVSFSIPAFTSSRAFAGSEFAKSTARTCARRKAATSSGCCSRNCVRTMTCVVTNFPSGQRLRSSTSTTPPPSRTRRVAHGSGTHAPWISPARNVSSVCAFACGTTATSPPPSRFAESPCAFSQARSATSCVLPSCGVASFLPIRSAGFVIDGCTTRAAPPEVAPATMRIAFPSDFANALIAGFGPM